MRRVVAVRAVVVGVVIRGVVTTGTVVKVPVAVMIDLVECKR